MNSLFHLHVVSVCKTDDMGQTVSIIGSSHMLIAPYNGPVRRPGHQCTETEAYLLNIQACTQSVRRVPPPLEKGIDSVMSTTAYDN